MTCKALQSISEYVLIGGLGCATAAIVGTIMPSIGIIGGIALTGIATAIALPFMYFIPEYLKRTIVQIRPSSDSTFFGMWLLRLGLFFAAIAAAHAICVEATSLPPFSLQEAYKFAGIYTGMGLAIAAGCASLYTSSRFLSISLGFTRDDYQVRDHPRRLAHNVLTSIRRDENGHPL